MIRKILQKEDPALHKVCHPVTSFDRKLGALLDDLTATLKDAQGLGLAAPQHQNQPHHGQQPRGQTLLPGLQ